MFQYYGSSEGMHRFLDRNRDNLRRAYREVLGNDLFMRVEAADEALLGPNSFFESSDLVSLGVTARTSHPKFMVLFMSDNDKQIQFQPDGHLSVPVEDKLTMAPAFVMDDQAFELNRDHYEDWISPYGAGYIHEYDHFVVFALQERPLMAASLLLLDKIQPEHWPVDLPEIEGLALKAEGTLMDKKIACYLTVFAWQLDQLYEFSTRRVDTQIFKRLGYRVPDDYYKSKPREYLPVPFSKLGMIVVMPIDGDPLYGESARNRLRSLSDWSEHFRGGSEYQDNFIESFNTLTIEKMALTPEIREKAFHQAREKMGIAEKSE
jgi:hypothetical protein